MFVSCQHHGPRQLIKSPAGTRGGHRADLQSGHRRDIGALQLAPRCSVPLRILSTSPRYIYPLNILSRYSLSTSSVMSGAALLPKFLLILSMPCSTGLCFTGLSPSCHGYLQDRVSQHIRTLLGCQPNLMLYSRKCSREKPICIGCSQWRHTHRLFTRYSHW